MSKAQFRVLMLLMVAGVALSVFISGCTDTGRIEELQSRVNALERGRKIVEAEGFRLVDKEGKTRAALGLGNDGYPSLRLYDAAGVGRAELHLGDNGTPSLTLLGDNWQIHAMLLVAQDGSSGLMFLDTNGNRRAFFSLSEHGRPSLNLYDAAGNLRTVVGCTETVFRRSGVEQKHSESTVTLFDDSGDVIWQAP